MEATQPATPNVKPVRRSVTFWLGLMTFSFLLWIWGDSFFHSTRIMLGRKPPKEPFEAVIEPGRLTVEWREGPWLTPPPLWGKFRIGRGRQGGHAYDLWLPRFYGWSDGQRYFLPPGTTLPPGPNLPPGTPSAPIRTYSVQIALWMPPAAFLLIWAPILMLSRRRQRRGAMKFASIPPGS